MPRIGGLYVIIDPAACLGRDPVMVARAALEGGASMLQWRDKQRDKGDQIADAEAVLELCLRNDAYLIVNDHADLALVLGAGLVRVPGAGSAGKARALAHIGVHVGQKDLPVDRLRRILPGGAGLGASTNNVEEARRAAAAGAGYIAVGDIFGTGSKQGTRAASIDLLTEIKRAVSKPVIGIGGINAANAASVVRAGADGVAVISAVCGA
ncbi:MAG: thiamine phosphate synthase, partial [bacterium]